MKFNLRPLVAWKVWKSESQTKSLIGVNVFGSFEPKVKTNIKFRFIFRRYFLSRVDNTGFQKITQYFFQPFPNNSLRFVAKNSRLRLQRPLRLTKTLPSRIQPSLGNNQWVSDLVNINVIGFGSNSMNFRWPATAAHVWWAAADETTISSFLNVNVYFFFVLTVT